MTPHNVLVRVRATFSFVLCGIIVLMSSCNGDVFIDADNIPDDVHITLAGDGGEEEFTISTKRLERISLDLMSEAQVYCTYYDTAGNVIDEKSPASKVGSIVYKSPFKMLRISKSGGNVKVCSVYNTDNTEWVWIIRLDYDYGSWLVDVLVTPDK